MNEEIIIYADGSCSCNPGLMGIGVYLKYGKHEKRISKAIGHGTNNIAELVAIKEAILSIKNKDIPIKIYTDSQYSQKTIMGVWNASSNIELIYSIQKLIKQFKDVQILWVRGHSGVLGNEIANDLAEKAIGNR